MFFCCSGGCVSCLIEYSVLSFSVLSIGICQIDYCAFTSQGGALQLISGDSSISLFLDEPHPVCIGCLFLGGLGQTLQPTTVYEISKGGVTTPLDGVEGVTVNDNNGTLFVEDASAVFAVNDELRCTYMSTTHISSIVATSKPILKLI